MRNTFALVLFLGGILSWGLILPQNQAADPRVVAPLAAPPELQTAFQASFSRAREYHLRARIITKQQLEALEEWDPDSIRRSIPEIYRRSFIKRTREIGLARDAASEACRRAKTSDQVYRADRLLASIERDLRLIR
jgi:hypothetical protein